MHVTGWNFWRFNARLGLTQILRGTDYFRFYEFPRVFELAQLDPGLSVLDMGCGKSPFPLFVAKHTQTRLIITDIDEQALRWQRNTAIKLGLADRFHDGSLRIEYADSTALPYKDNSFDRCINLGSIEHIPNDGDIAAIREIARVLKPGGKAVLSIPYSPMAEEHPSTDHWGGFERRYDNTLLQTRFLESAGLRELQRIYFGEPGVKFSDRWYAIPFVLKLPFRNLIGIASQKFLKTIPPKQHEQACGVQLVLEKP